jgi:hypothetical protein
MIWFHFVMNLYPAKLHKIASVYPIVFFHYNIQFIILNFSNITEILKERGHNYRPIDLYGTHQSIWRLL